MRDRYRSDWTRDLAGRHELERSVALAIQRQRGLRLITSQTDQFDQLDYTVATRTVASAFVELKAKWQPYKGWSQHRPDIDNRDLFILDELALRKIIGHAPHAYLVIRDQPQNRWSLYGATDLVLAPKTRAVRTIRRQRTTQKGKVLIDLTDGHLHNTLPDLLTHLITTINATQHAWNRVEPWPYPNTGAAS